MISHQNSYGADTTMSSTETKGKPHYIILKVIQALNLLEQFHDDVDELGLIELSRRLGMKKERLELLLATLMARNYIEQNRATKGYRLGFNNLQMAQTALRQTDLHRVSPSVLASVAKECGETTSVAVLRKSSVTELYAVHSKHPVQVVSRVGLHLPIHCTSAGKLLTASETDQGLERLFKGGELARYTRNTVTCVDELRRHLRRIIEKGYAVDDEELDQEVRSVAAAIRDCTGRVVGAVVITGPSCRIGLDRLTGELIPLVQRGARKISAKLGFQAQPSCDPVKEVEFSTRQGVFALRHAQKVQAARHRAATCAPAE